MNANIRIARLCSISVITFCLILAMHAPAQTFKIVLNSTNGPVLGGLIGSGSILYGTFATNASDSGEIGSVHTDGTGFTTLYKFTATSTNGQGQITNSDGANPAAPLALAGSTLYGTTTGGGAFGWGTVFKINVDGTGFMKLVDLLDTNNLGGFAHNGVIVSGTTLFGMTHESDAGCGTVYSVNTDGTGFTNLHVLQGTGGGEPCGNLVVSGNTLYGTTYYGDEDTGTVFAINADGTGFTTLHNFISNFSVDGGYPRAGLVISGDTLYGTTSEGGAGNYGTIFSINTDGSGFKVLHTFTGVPYYSVPTNSDGAQPIDPLVLVGNTLYGTTLLGGTNGYGTIFAINTDGTGFNSMYSFPAGTDWNEPISGVTWSDGVLYGTSAGSPVSLLYGITPPTTVAIALSGANVILTWPTNIAGFTLQSTPSLNAPAAWTPVSAAPVVVNGLNTVTNSMSAAQEFYRLSQ